MPRWRLRALLFRIIMFNQMLRKERKNMYLRLVLSICIYKHKHTYLNNKLFISYFFTWSLTSLGVATSKHDHCNYAELYSQSLSKFFYMASSSLNVIILHFCLKLDFLWYSGQRQSWSLWSLVIGTHKLTL